MSTSWIADLAAHRAAGRWTGIASICTAHPTVIEAALRHGKAADGPVLIEATCNQVNQEGGYAGMRPGDFRRFVEAIADRVSFSRADLILGGDHLGPNPWKHLAAEEAMRRAEAMVAAYAQAGFTKLHLDTSMGCRGEGAALPDTTVAARAARLAKVAEAAIGDSAARPVYVIGTEVPTPGGASAALHDLDVTRPEAALNTIEVHRQAFGALALDAAFERTVGLVVQPGVEFGNADVAAYRPERATALCAALSKTPGFVFEAHSTDYQTPEALAALVDDGFAILKVGPWLTFALREVLYGLDHIAQALAPFDPADSLPAAMERLMLREPLHWVEYYRGDQDEQRIQRHFGYSDRIRYYWPHDEARAAVARLMARLDGRVIPEPLISQYLAALHPDVALGRVKATTRDLRLAGVQRVLRIYSRACAADRPA